MVRKEGAAKSLEEEPAAKRQPKVSHASTDEGVQLVRAFVAVKDPRVRKAILELVKKLS